MNHQTDRELTELAAKAFGVAAEGFSPLTDDGDALRLAVKLGLSVVPYPIYQPEKHSVLVKQRRQSDTMREANPTQVIELYGGDPYAAARRAITRAAAEVAKAGGES